LRNLRIALALALLISTLVTPVAVGSPLPDVPGSGSRTFPETGKIVRGVFLDYWDNNGGLPQQGYPISAELQEISDLNGKTYTVQYFERAVFEYHPENRPPYDVLLSQLGTFRYKEKYPSAIKVAQPAPRSPCTATHDDSDVDTGAGFQPQAPQRQSVGKGLALSGFVLSSKDCKPIAGVKIEMRPEVGGQHPDSQRATLFTDATGQYHFESQFPQHIHMRVSAHGFKTIIANGYHTSTGRSVDTFDIVLMPDPSCVQFPQTDQSLCGAFRDYWQTHGGLPQQGYPISDEFDEKSDLNGKTYTVQYFERAVFEHHPENQAPYDILLSQLGTFRYAAKYSAQIAPTPGPYTGPAARAGHELVYDDVRKVVLMLNAGDVAGDAEGSPTRLWSWNGREWKLLSTGGPPTRSLGGAAFDSRRGVLVIHGGVTNNFNYNDTWEWNGTRWDKKTTTPNPGFRHHFLMAYDSARGMIVAYGGNLQGDQTAQSELTFPTDTWTWDGQTWKQVDTTGLGTRYHYAMTYDSVRKTTLIFGGSAHTSNRNDLWSWDGAKWTQLTSSGDRPTSRSSPAMAYDERTGKTILFGGRVASSVLNDTWSWDGSKWTQLQISGPIPPARSHHAMTYDKSRQKIVMFGGIAAGADDNYLADTWEFDGTMWTKVSGP
jgi:hypothetical protein